MRSNNKVRNFVCGIFVILFIILFSMLTSIGVVAQPKRFVEIVANNTYNIYIMLEYKCDMDPETKEYKVKETIYIPGNSKATIRVPKNVKSCEIWPTAKFNFGGLK